MKKQELTFEEAIANLEGVVSELENGDLPLEETITKFKSGIEMSATCTKMLEDAEKTITMLLKDSEGNVVGEENFKAE